MSRHVHPKQGTCGLHTLFLSIPSQALRRQQFRMRQEKAAEEEEGEGPRPKAKAKAKGRPKAKGKAKAKAQSKPKAKSKAKASPEPTADGTVGATADAGEAETNDEVSGKAVPSEPIHEDCAPSKATSEKVQASVEKGAPSEAVAEKSGPLEADPEKDEPAVDPQMGCSKVDPTGQPSNPASSKARSAKANVDGKDVSSKARLARAKSSANLPEEEEAKKPAPTKRRRVKETPETTDGLKDLPVEPQGDKNSTPKPMEPLDSKMGEKCSEVADPAEVGKKRARKSEDGSGKKRKSGAEPPEEGILYRGKAAKKKKEDGASAPAQPDATAGKKSRSKTFAKRYRPNSVFGASKWDGIKEAFDEVIRPNVDGPYTAHEDTDFNKQHVLSNCLGNALSNPFCMLGPLFDGC